MEKIQILFISSIHTLLDEKRIFFFFLLSIRDGRVRGVTMNHVCDPWVAGSKRQSFLSSERMYTILLSIISVSVVSLHIYIYIYYIVTKNTLTNTNRHPSPR